MVSYFGRAVPRMGFHPAYLCLQPCVCGRGATFLDYPPPPPAQDLLIFDSVTYGRVLVLDGAIQVTERDEVRPELCVRHWVPSSLAHVLLTLPPCNLHTYQACV